MESAPYFPTLASRHESTGSTGPPARRGPRGRVLPTPLWWRAAILAVAGGKGGLLFGPQFAWAHDRPPRASRARRLCFLVFAAAFSTNLRAVRWRTIGVGLFLQIVLASVVLQNTYVQDKFKIAASGAMEC